MLMWTPFLISVVGIIVMCIIINNHIDPDGFA